jgi:hypothetical protein
MGGSTLLTVICVVVVVEHVSRSVLSTSTCTEPIFRRPFFVRSSQPLPRRFSSRLLLSRHAHSRHRRLLSFPPSSSFSPAFPLICRFLIRSFLYMHFLRKCPPFHRLSPRARRRSRRPPSLTRRPPSLPRKRSVKVFSGSFPLVFYW